MTAIATDGLVDRLAAAIQGRILSGEIATGARLRQASLASDFGVSRTPVREALRKLESSGLVVVEPNRGAVVLGPNARAVRGAYAVRAELEGFAAEEAARHIHDAQLERLREAEAIFRTSIEQVIEDRQNGIRRDWTMESAWERANNLFHSVIQEAAENPQLVESIEHLHRRFPRFLTWTALNRSTRLLSENIEQHHRVLMAIEARDPAAARATMAEHIRTAGELVARLLEGGEYG